MNMDIIAPIIQKRITEKFIELLKQKYPNIIWNITFTSEITAEKTTDGASEAMSNSLEPQWIEPHERQNKDGGVTLVKGYWKQPKSLTAMDIAIIEANEETGKNLGVNIEAEFESFVNALTSGATSLGQMN